MKDLKIYLLAIIVGFSSISCIVDEEIDKNDELFNGPLVVGFKDDVTLGNFVEEIGATFDFYIPAHVIGGSEGQPSETTISMSYALGTLEDLNLSDDEIATMRARDIAAINGTHYDFVNTADVITIPENGTFARIPLKVYNDALDNSKTTYFVLNITTVTTSDNVVLSEQLKSTLVQIQLCRTDLSGTYTSLQNGTGSYTITHLGSGNYELSSMFGWSTRGYTSYFYACAGNLIFTEWQFSNDIIQGVPGRVDPVSGNIFFEEFGIENVYSGWTVELRRN